MIPSKPIVLEGKNAENFDKYMRRKATKKEIEFFKRADEYYKDRCKKVAKKRAAKK